VRRLKKSKKNPIKKVKFFSDGVTMATLPLPLRLPQILHPGVQGRIQGGVLGVKTPTLFGKPFQFARVF